jgi:hypothetical protein
MLLLYAATTSSFAVASGPLILQPYPYLPCSISLLLVGVSGCVHTSGNYLRRRVSVVSRMGPAQRVCLLQGSCLLLILACYLAPTPVQGHGYLYQPVSRNWRAHLDNKFWDQQSGNGLGTSAPPGNPGGSRRWSNAEPQSIMCPAPSDLNRNTFYS